jgi:hypothetical protein
MHARLKTFSGGKFLLHRCESLQCGGYLRIVGPTYRRKRDSGLEKGESTKQCNLYFINCRHRFIQASKYVILYVQRYRAT